MGKLSTVLIACALASGGAYAQESSAEIQQLKAQVADQQKQIDELRRMIQAQNAGVRATQALASPITEPQPPMPTVRRAPALGEVASLTPVIPAPAAAASLPPQREPRPAEQPSPLSLRLGSAYLTPVGFMDMTAVFRDTTAGSGIGTNFGSFPYRTPGNVPGNLSEFRMSPQNSRVGLRVDANVKGARVIGYWESDFLGGLGNPPTGNVAVSSNSYAPRLRLFWVDVRKDKFELLAGQTWSLMTPNRRGVSPLPSDIFNSQDIDVNYQLGLVWGRYPEFRFAYHPTEKLAIAFALGSAEQYIGGSAGGGPVTLPSALATPYATELNTGANVLNVPNLHPDLIAKVAYDPSSRLHLEVAGVERTFKTYNPLTGQHFTAIGGGISANLGVDLAKGLRLLVNNYVSDGGGRYIFGQAPDAVVRGDGSLSLVHAASEVAGFEFTRGKNVIEAYYGGVYIGRNSIIDPANGKYVGYGFAGSPNSQNRTIQEGTIGFTRTFWKDPSYGALAFMAQYSYMTRNPWFVASGTPSETHLNEAFINLRYTLPGAAPSVIK